MVAYATAEEVRSVVARDQNRPGGTAARLENEPIDAQIADAQAEVDSRLAGRYAVPFTGEVPALVKVITVDIAAYLATILYLQSRDFPDGDPMVRRYERAQKLLDALHDGTADLVDPDGPTGPAAAPESTSSIGEPVNPYAGVMFGMSDFGLGYGRDRGCW